MNYKYEHQQHFQWKTVVFGAVKALTLTILHVERTGARYVCGSHSAVSNTEMNKGQMRGGEDERQTGPGQRGLTLTCWFSEAQFSPPAGRGHCCRMWQVCWRVWRSWWGMWLQHGVQVSLA